MHYDLANELVSYDCDSGNLHWRSDLYIGFKKSVIAHKAGDVATCKRKDGRNVIRLNGKIYLGYRIAWLLHYGEQPLGEIDHINGDCEDDRISNLRLCNRKTNQENLRFAQKNKSSCELLGVYLDKRKKEGSKRWRSAITTNGNQISLGYFHTKEEAQAAYIAAKRVVHAGCTI